jgi:hypothetical protein
LAGYIFTYIIETAMENRTRLLSNWNRVKKRLQEKFSILTDEDLYLHTENQDEMLRKIGEKLGMQRQFVLKMITTLL